MNIEGCSSKLGDRERSAGHSQHCYLQGWRTDKRNAGNPALNLAERYAYCGLIKELPNTEQYRVNLRVKLAKTKSGTE